MARRHLATAVLIAAAVLAVALPRALANDVDGHKAKLRASALLFEDFDSGSDWTERWKHSSADKYTGRFTTAQAKDWKDKGLKMPDKSKHYGLAALLAGPVEPVVGPGAPLVVQYEVKYSEGVTCGGAYLKLLSADPDLSPEGLVDSTPYSLMFGPDKCGGPGKVHLILRARNPGNGTITERHLASPPVPDASDYTHVYTLKLSPDHKYEISIDGEVKSSGDLLAEGVMAPPLLPPREVPDPDHTKPDDWVDLAVIPDPDATKPADWDDREKVEDEAATKPRGWLDNESPMIDDPAAVKPEEWDDDEDGVWTPNQIVNPKCKVGCGVWKRPLKPNPAYKGAWKPPVIDNPAYKGPWTQRRIPNPDYYEDSSPLTSSVAPIGGVALELWTVDSGYMFDNLLVTRDPQLAALALEKLWKPRHDDEVNAFEGQIKKNQEAEKERKRKEREERKKNRKKSGRRGSEQLEALADGFLNLFEPGAALAPLAPLLEPLLEWLRGNPEGIVLLIGVTPLLLLTLLMIVRTSGRKKSPKDLGAAAAKKTDAVQPDDEPPAEGDDSVAPAVAAAGEAEAQGVVSGQAAEAVDVADEDDDEQDEPAAGGARRRTRRAA
ncbi:hypothetical protein HYH02_012329 [Chlamydomonas schloesseri]|uniref:Calnexin n=1 Tax=Chlamydomonas schloesseri TaxID=2026947 RepID=A0A835VYT2_9CHLO|nr:hypothetical protein HYH02_012329 [Chlamydomonas schloesseri]|eukprot:KAG2434307.1 hypothetical protein HYH02_012329 [Chlamydomonas schloesseri]